MEIVKLDKQLVEKVQGWKDSLETTDGIKIFKSVGCLKRHAVKQYSGLKWMHLDFTDDIIKFFAVKNVGFLPSGINILPWRIYRSDIIAKEAKDKSRIKYNILIKSSPKSEPRCVNELQTSLGEYKDIIEQNPNFVDFDPKTGNIHKKVNNLWQIVLTRAGSDAGPSYHKDAKHFIDAINCRAYTPEITTNDDEKDYSVDELIRLVFKKLGIRVKDDLI